MVFKSLPSHDQKAILESFLKSVEDRENAMDVDLAETVSSIYTTVARRFANDCIAKRIFTTGSTTSSSANLGGTTQRAGTSVPTSAPRANTTRYKTTVEDADSVSYLASPFLCLL